MHDNQLLLFALNGFHVDLLIIFENQKQTKRLDVCQFVVVFFKLATGFVSIELHPTSAVHQTEPAPLLGVLFIFHEFPEASRLSGFGVVVFFLKIKVFHQDVPWCQICQYGGVSKKKPCQLTPTSLNCTFKIKHVCIETLFKQSHANVLVSYRSWSFRNIPPRNPDPKHQMTVWMNRTYPRLTAEMAYIIIGMLLLLQNHRGQNRSEPVPQYLQWLSFHWKSHYVHQHEIKMICLCDNPTWALADAFPSLPPRKRSRFVGLWMDC